MIVTMVTNIEERGGDDDARSKYVWIDGCRV